VDVGFSLGDVIMKACFCLCGQVYLALGANPTGHFLAQFFWESRLSSKSLEPFIGLLAYLEPKLWLKNQTFVKILLLQTLTWTAFCILPQAISHQPIDLEQR